MRTKGDRHARLKRPELQERLKATPNTMKNIPFKVTKKCAVCPGTAALSSFHIRIMCQPCWVKVPREKRTRLLSTLVRYRKASPLNPNFTLIRDDYLAAVRDAISSAKEATP